MGIFHASALHFKPLFLVTFQWISLYVPGCLLQSNSDISNVLEVPSLLSLAQAQLCKQRHPTSQGTPGGSPPCGGQASLGCGCEGPARCFESGEQGDIGIRPALQPPGDFAQKQLNIFFLVHDFTTPAVRYHLALCVRAG